MPFDGSLSDNPLALFAWRRQQADDLWRDIPYHQFNLRWWRRRGGGETLSACALGWLAEREIDGWHWAWCSGVDRYLPTRCEDGKPFTEAAAYFGLTKAQALLLFGRQKWPSTWFYRWPRAWVSGVRVADALRRQPITVAAEVADAV